MALKPVNYILTSKDLSGSNRAWMLKLKGEIERRRGIKIILKDALAKSPVYARIYRGHWIADCECGGAMFVDYDDPVFFCMECFNGNQNGKLRPVIFPDDRQDIEAAILERPAVGAGATDTERAGKAVVKAGSRTFTRDWIPSETAEDIRKQNQFIAGLMPKKRGK